MAKGAYIGVNGIARKIKGGYIGVDGVARKIKKAYIGIGGVARPCWSEGAEPILTYYGTTAGLSVARTQLAATTVGNYALFGGGYNDSYSSVVNAYDATLTRTTPATLSTTVKTLAATTVGDYALFGGGYDGSSYSSGVDAYDKSLTKTVATSLSESRGMLVATSNGTHGIFFGGWHDITNTYVGSPVADAYDVSLTRTTSTASFGYMFMAATSVGNYALFHGGVNLRWNGCSTRLQVFDQSLTNTELTASNDTCKAAATTVGEYAIFAGGLRSSTSLCLQTGGGALEYFTSSLTQSQWWPLTVARHSLAATTVGDYALFAGGSTGSNSDANPNSTVDVYDKSMTRSAATSLNARANPNSTVDVYDKSMTRSAATSLNAPRYDLCAITVGNHALFAGGQGTSCSSVVDVYTVA